MTSHEPFSSRRVVCNRSRAIVRSDEGLLGFNWWELDPPDEGTDELLQLDGPLVCTATYLVA